MLGMHRLAILMMAAVCCVGPMRAQTGAIEGMVRDPSSASVAAATVRVTETGTDARREAVADKGGRYSVLGLTPGNYEIQVSSDGFKTERRTGIDLAAGRTIRLDFELELGDLQEEVVVEADAPLVSASVADWGSRIEEKDLEDLPVNGRDLFQLAGLEAGANISTVKYGGITAGLGIQIAVNGARPSRNSFKLDGVFINDSSNSVPVSASGQQLGMESIRELHVVTSPFSAEYGRLSGAAFTAVSKSGSNSFHGSLYEYFRNSSLDARNFFDVPGESIPPLRRNQFGGMMSGPIRHDRVFFLANYEAVRESLGRTVRSVVPDADARQGFVPVSGGVNQVAIAPEIQPYLDLYPLPNGADFGDSTGEYVNQSSRTTRDDYITGKIDVIPAARWRLSGRYTFDDGGSKEPDPLRLMKFVHDSRYQLANAELQRIHSPNTIYTVRFGASRVRNDELRTVGGAIPSSLEFIPGQGLGSVRVTGLADIGGATAEGLPRGFTNTDFQVNGDLSHIAGRHTIRLGGTYHHIQFDQLSARSFVGQYRFGSLTDFLLGATRTGQAASLDSDPYRKWLNSELHGFIQEEFRASPRLSLSAGVRYETATVPTEADGRSAALRDPLHDSEVTIGPMFRNPSRTNFAPRASLAWDPIGSGKTVFRAGGGLFFDLLGSRQLVIAGTRAAPFYRRLSVSQPAFPDLASVIAGNDSPGEINGVEFDMIQPYVARWEASIERELGPDKEVRISYSGARGIHLLGNVVNMNPTTPVYLADGRVYFSADAPRLNPAFDNIGMRRPQFNSFYHGVSIAFQGNLWRDLRLQANYTFAKSIDESSSDVVVDFENSDRVPTMLNYRLNRGPSDFDLRHVFTANFSYLIPGPSGGVAEKIVGGWAVNGIAQVQSGSPFSPEVGFDRANLAPGGSEPGQRPDLAVAPGTDLILGDPEQWFDPLGFSLPEAGFYGNLGRNTLVGPGLVNLNLTVNKDLWRRERHRVSFRAEFFNLTNHPNFQIPSERSLFNTRGQRISSAGRITSTSTSSRQVQLAVRWEF